MILFDTITTFTRGLNISKIPNQKFIQEPHLCLKCQIRKNEWPTLYLKGTVGVISSESPFKE